MKWLFLAALLTAYVSLEPDAGPFIRRHLVRNERGILRCCCGAEPASQPGLIKEYFTCAY